MSAGELAGIASIIPLFGGALVVLTGRWPNVRETCSLASAVALLCLVITITCRVLGGEAATLEIVQMVPGISIAFSLEPLGILFALVASGLWIITTTYAIGYMRAHHEENQTRFFLCFALAISGVMGVAFAGNVLTLFIFYELITLSTFPLVTHAGTDAAKKAGRVYLGILLSTSVGFLLMAIIWTWHITGTLDFTTGGILEGKASPTMVMILLALYAFGTGKAALMPFHRWLPAAMVAPTPVSALLHAVAVVKAGVFTILKVVVYIFGIDFLHTTGASTWLMYVAGATILFASLVAITKDNLKARLAYSTISQLSYIVLGAALANAWGIIGGGMHIAMHAFGKITLFFCAGAIMVASHKTKISEMKGIGRTMPITMIAFLIGSLSVIGLPPLGGTWSKWYLALGAAEAHHVALVAVLMISSLLNVGYLLPVAIRAFFLPEESDAKQGIKEAPAFCVVPICLTAIGCLVLFFFAGEVYKLLLPITQS